MNIASLHKAFLASEGVSTDTRTLQGNQVFFALKGENFDGNRFVPEALEKGCPVVVGDDPSLSGHDRLLKVPSSLETLQELAAYHRRQKKVKVIALTGSNGKTTTKELIHQVLKTQYSVLATRGNLNNHIGVPLTLLEIKDEDIAVIEMGANSMGEIARLCELADPGTGLITNVGKAHLEGFGSLEGVKKAKGELYDYLASHHRYAYLNLSNDHLVAMAHERGLQVKGYSTGGDCYLQGRIEQADPFLEVMVSAGEDLFHLQTALVGSYNLENIMAAVAVGQDFGIGRDAIRQALETYQPANHRSQQMQGKTNTVVMDAYNANPTSMHAALDDFLQYTGGRRGVILGDMLEVGAGEEEEHRRLLERLTEARLETVVLVGRIFSRFADAYPRFHFFDTADACEIFLHRQKPSHTTFLVKGSRRISLEKTTKPLLDC